MAQPSKVKTCGSTFKNIDENNKAWKLIKEAGCNNFKEGDAMISQKHCNFFINNGKAKSADIEKLINRVKKTVYEKTWFFKSAAHRIARKREAYVSLSMAKNQCHDYRLWAWDCRKSDASGKWRCCCSQWRCSLASYFAEKK